MKSPVAPVISESLIWATLLQVGRVEKKMEMQVTTIKEEKTSSVVIFDVAEMSTLE